MRPQKFYNLSALFHTEGAETKRSCDCPRPNILLVDEHELDATGFSFWFCPWTFVRAKTVLGAILFPLPLLQIGHESRDTGFWFNFLRKLVMPRIKVWLVTCCTFFKTLESALSPTTSHWKSKGLTLGTPITPKIHVESQGGMVSGRLSPRSQ